MKKGKLQKIAMPAVFELSKECFFVDLEGIGWWVNPTAMTITQATEAKVLPAKKRRKFDE